MGILSTDHLDDRAELDEAVVVTLLLQIVCLLLAINLFIMRLFQVYQESKAASSAAPYRILLLRVSHLCAMFFFTVFIFLHVWNYTHFFASRNPMRCDTWFILKVMCTTIGKNCVYIFLMMRSSVAFEIRFFQIPLTISIVVIVFSVTTQWTVSAMMLSDFEGSMPFSDNGFCFRSLGSMGQLGESGDSAVDALSALIALVVFWWKARYVKKGIAQLEQATGNSDEMRGVHQVFTKHIVLGILILVGSIICFFAIEFLMLLTGLVSVLHHTATCLYMFLFFKENSVMYNKLCCRGADEMGEVSFMPQPSNSSASSLASTKSGANTLSPLPALQMVTSSVSRTGTVTLSCAMSNQKGRITAIIR